MLIAPRIRMLHLSRSFHTLKMFAIAASAAAQHDDNVAGVVSRAPVPVILVRTDGPGQIVLWAEIIDGRGFAVSVAEDGGMRLFLVRKTVVDAGHFAHHVLPPELIC